jgi:hypothetical protein
MTRQEIKESRWRKVYAGAQTQSSASRVNAKGGSAARRTCHHAAAAGFWHSTSDRPPRQRAGPARGLSLVSLRSVAEFAGMALLQALNEDDLGEQGGLGTMNPSIA